MKKSFFLIIAAFYSIFALSAQDSPLLISKDDIRIEGGSGKFKDSDGWHLFIRKRPGVESVMLTETTKDPTGNMDNYAYRALEYNSVNGDEIRYLNGKRLSSEMAKFSLIDSTAEKDEQFGQAFHIFIPSTIAYGYQWSRHGTIKIDKGTFINIRAFSKKYGDYTGNFYDNPFMFDLGAPVKKPVPAPTPIPEPAPLPDAIEEPVVLTDDYNPVAANAFSDIAEFNGGTLCYSRGPDTLVDDIMDSLERISPKQKVDVIFAIDTTGSMKDDVQKLREDWIPRLIASLKDYGNLRIGLLLYRDYGDTYRLMGLPVKRFEFTDKIEVFTKNLNNFVIYGNEGGDIPEAVYEALYASLAFYKWRIDATRKIILIGDAEPHPTPRGTGKYSKELVAQTAKAKGVVIDAIIVPDDKSARGR
ncbi:MAG TPA: hypothetical protein DCF70_06800 [Treponema sp.]|nr:hypothetical protein [Treponema sp.]